MILLDTNVISEMMKSQPSTNLIKWLGQQETLDLFITSVTIAEIIYGLEALPKSKRRAALEKAFHVTLAEAFQSQILFFDDAAAYQYGQIMARSKKIGHPMSILDGQICAIAQANHAMIATRNVKDFAHCKLPLINPFTY